MIKKNNENAQILFKLNNKYCTFKILYIRRRSFDVNFVNYYYLKQVAVLMTAAIRLDIISTSLFKVFTISFVQN